MKRRVKRHITGCRPLLRLPARLTARLPRVLVYHRFAAPGAQVNHRLSADEFSWQLDVIARDFQVVSLGDCVERFLTDNRWPRDCVVITIDDGYRDMYEWAYPELKKREMPATVFVTTRFIDGDTWLWPDRIRFSMDHTVREMISLELRTGVVQLPLGTTGDKQSAWKRLSDECIAVSDGRRQELLSAIECEAGVVVPPVPPLDYGAVTWGELREMQDAGIEVGAHTLSHPILSRVPHSCLQREIAGSKCAVEDRLRTPVRSFCYPNSAPGDINDEVVAAVRSAGFRCAVFGTDLTHWDPYLIPRMAVSEDRVDFLWKCHGWERLSLSLAGRDLRLHGARSAEAGSAGAGS